jgi:hypothetical protein
MSLKEKLHEMLDEDLLQKYNLNDYTDQYLEHLLDEYSPKSWLNLLSQKIDSHFWKYLKILRN